MNGGNLNAFVLVTAATVLACLGLVLDGAEMVRAKAQVTALAHESARLGAQHLDTERVRAGELALDDGASDVVRAHVNAAGDDAEVELRADRVTVVVSRTHRPSMLTVLGDKEISSRATAIAHTP